MGGVRRDVLIVISTVIMSLYSFGGVAQTSPDGSSITAPGTGQLVAQGSVWAVGAPNPHWVGQYDVVKDGVDIGWSGDSMRVSDAGSLYMIDSNNTVWLWQADAGTFVKVPYVPPALPSLANPTIPESSPPETVVATVTEAPNLAPALPSLTLTFSPANPTIPESSPPGTVVATVTAAWSDGSPFTGTLSFGLPYNDDGGTFVLSGNKLIVSPLGLGLLGDGGTVQLITVVAMQ